MKTRAPRPSPPKERPREKPAAPKKKRASRKRAPSAVAIERRGTPRRGGTESNAAGVAELQLREIEALRADIERRKADLERGVPRWNANPEDVQKSVAQLVLALVEFLRKLLERQAIRRMEAETLSPTETEQVGLALMRLEETVHDLASKFGLSPEELNLDLGPLGRLV